MRFLHTADWHAGKPLQGRSRLDEHEAALADIAGIARRENADFVLVAGDLFDSASPSPEAERIVFHGLLALADVAPVVVVPGNHDNERRLSALAPLFDLARVTVRSSVRRDSVVIETKAGETARIACIPWLSQRYIVKAAQLMEEDAAETRGHYEERMQLIVDAVTEAFEKSSVNILMGHLTIAGAEHGGGERTAQTIFDYWVNSTIFPTSAHYVALGHLHKPQRMAAGVPVHYPGSPLQLDFGDAPGPRSVLMVEASPSAPAKIEPVALTSGRALRTIRGKLEELRALSGTTGDDFLRVIVEEKASVGLGDEVRELFPDAVKVIVESGDKTEGRSPGAHQQSLSPGELFRAYLSERDVADERLVKLFDELHEEIHASH